MKAGEFYRYDEETGMPVYSGHTHFIKESVRQTLCGIRIHPKAAVDYCHAINVDCKRCKAKRKS